MLDWDHTIAIMRALRPARKTAVIITKHWIPVTDDHVSQLLELERGVQHIEQRSRLKRSDAASASADVPASGRWYP